MKGNKIKNIIILILGIMCISLIFFIIYDKYNDKDTTSSDNNNEVGNALEDNNNVLLAGQLFSNLLTDEQRKTVNLDKDFKDVEIDINGVSVTYSCEKYVETPEARCTEAIVSFGNHIINIDNGNLGCGHSENIIYTEDYLILQEISACTETGTIYIFDNNDNKLFETHSAAMYDTDDNREVVDVSINLINNKLYYYTYDLEENDNPPEEKYSSYIDLNDTDYTIHRVEE